jgi:two-component system CheB/CheR fusion protein
MDGHSLLQELRKLAPTATTPAIALSGYTRPYDVKRTLDAGFNAHLCKPVVLKELIALAGRLCR